MDRPWWRMEQMLITHRNAGQNVLTHEVLSEVYDLTYRLNNIQATLNGEPVGTLWPPVWAQCSAMDGASSPGVLGGG